MDSKTTGIVSYFTWIGLLIATLAGDKQGARFHINQSLVIQIGFIVAAVLRYFPFFGGLLSNILNLYLLVCAIIGIIGAAQGREMEAPIIGAIKIMK